MTGLKCITVLLVEDNEGDVYFFREALEEVGLLIHLKVVPDGQAAMDCLRRPDFKPDVVILDLNLPIKNGREVLEEMNEDPRLRAMPVAILTSSRCESDVALRDSKENCVFFSKTPDIAELREIVTEIHEFALKPSSKH